MILKFFNPNLFALSICFAFLFGCKQQKIEKKRITNFSIEAGIEKDAKINLSEIAKEISFIPLETISNCLLGDINSVNFYNDLIIVVDDLPQILLFQKDGKFIKKIGNVGKGPNEYLYVSKVQYSNKYKEIYVFDGSSSKIMAFDIDTGKCKKTKNINFYPSTMILLNDSTLAFYCSAATFPFSRINYHLLLLDINFKNVEPLWKGSSPDDINLKNMDRGFILTYMKDSNLVCWDSNIDSIFCLTMSKEKTPIFTLDFGKYTIPNKLKYDRNTYSKKNNDCFIMDKFIETDNYFFIEGVLGSRFMKNILYEKESGESKNIVFNYDFHDVGFHNDLDGGIPFWPQGIVAPNVLYDCMSPFELKRLMKHNYFKTIKIRDSVKNTTLKDHLKNAKITDNPILFILTLK